MVEVAIRLERWIAERMGLYIQNTAIGLDRVSYNYNERWDTNV